MRDAAVAVKAPRSKGSALSAPPGGCASRRGRGKGAPLEGQCHGGSAGGGDLDQVTTTQGHCVWSPSFPRPPGRRGGLSHRCKASLSECPWENLGLSETVVLIFCNPK